MNRETLRAELDWFESIYSVPSERLAEAFRIDGLLHETEHFHRWCQAYVAWQRFESAKGASSVQKMPDPYSA